MAISDTYLYSNRQVGPGFPTRAKEGLDQIPYQIPLPGNHAK